MYYIFRLKETIRDFLRYRLYRKYNIIKIHSLEPGYWDADTRLLHGMFDLLVDFIEIEKSHMQKIFDDTGKYNWYKKLSSWVPFLDIRDPEAGLKYLDWEIEFAQDCPGQSESAVEQKELYLWWKNRPNLEDPWMEWYNFHDAMLEKYNDITGYNNIHKAMTSGELTTETTLLNKCQKLEEVRLVEEESMLIRLIKIRQSLWT